MPETPIVVQADLVRLAQVIANLLTNAAQYTPRPARIWLTVTRGNDDVAIMVKDEGMGITPEMLDRVFELFVQADASPSRTQGGLGIGLTLVRRLVEMHGGTVTATSQGQGKGSEFIVRLPLEPRDQGSQDAPKPATSGVLAAMRNRRVLVIDDNADAADSIAWLLQASGFDVRCVYDGVSALSVASSYRPDIFVLDIGLPDITGYEVARRLRAIPDFSRTPIVAVTGYGQQSDREQSRDAGIDHHMTKPVDPDSLRSVLESSI